MTYETRYDDLSDDVLANEQTYSQNATIIDDSYSQLQQQGPPQHALVQLAPGAEDQQARSTCRVCKISPVWSKKTLMPMLSCSSVSEQLPYCSDSKVRTHSSPEGY